MKHKFNDLSICLFIILLSGCGSDDDHKDSVRNEWRFQNGEYFPNGLYSVEYDIKEDGCSPSLSQLRSREPTMSPHGLVVYGPNSSAFVRYFRLRTAGPQTLYLQREPSGDLRDRISESGEYTTGFGAYCEDSTQAFYQADFNRLARSTEPGVLRVKMIQTWSRQDGSPAPLCGGIERVKYAYTPVQTIPELPCEESYEIVYRLQEECPPECEIDSPRQVFFNQDDMARRYTYPDPDPQDWCVCDEKDP